MSSNGPPFDLEAVVTAVERLAACVNSPVVIKLGGSAMEDEAATTACVRTLGVLNRVGIPLVVLHGGGKPIDRAMTEAGRVPKKVAGRRYTDEATLAIVVRVLQEINQDLVARLRAVGCPADAYDRAEGFPLVGRRLLLPGLDLQPVDLGRVGEVTAVTPLDTGTRSGRPAVPVLPSLALDDDGGWLNVNADTAAAAVARFLKAERVVFLTDTPGVLRDRNDPTSVIPRLTQAGCRELIASGVIADGMIPKIEACLDALAAGARSACILDGRVPFSLLGVFLHDVFAGTEIVP